MAVYRVVVFKAGEDEFKSKARENRLTVRDFSYVDGSVRPSADAIYLLCT